MFKNFQLTSNKSQIRSAPLGILHSALGNRNSKTLIILGILFFVLLSSIGHSGEWSGYFATESRIFPESPLMGAQHGSSLSFSFQPEYYHEWARGDHSILFIPFFRYDRHDANRTHYDLREFYWQMIGNTWELRIGIRRVFWGVTESLHLVDIVNQSDQVENLDGEQKLGQPMVDFSLIRHWGTLQFFLLAGFRERTYPGVEGRMRFPSPVNTDQVVYESGAGQNHLDWAIRWSHMIGDFDIGLSHFSGTGRDPRFVPGSSEDGLPVLIPHYDLINQTGLDLQYTKGGWLWKLEAITRERKKRRFAAFAAGFEYTFGNLKNSGIDIGILAEYLYDSRDNNFFAPTPFQDDIFLGTRIAFNDVQSTDILAGTIIDRENGSTFLNIEASRRLDDSYKLALQIRSFLNVAPTDFLYGFRKDNYMRLEISKFF
jgi:hypothetical protein